MKLFSAVSKHRYFDYSKVKSVFYTTSIGYSSAGYKTATWVADSDGAVYIGACTQEDIAVDFYINSSSMRIFHRGYRSADVNKCWATGLYPVEKGDVVSLHYTRITNGGQPASIGIGFIPYK